MKNIERELSSAPIVRVVTQYKSEVDQKLDEIGNAFKEYDNKYFTKEEIYEYKTRLDNLENEFTKRLEDEIKDNNKLKEEINKIQEEINFLKNQVETLTKSNWIKSFASRTFKWGKRNPKVVHLTSLAKEMLPDNIKKSIPEGALDIIISEKDISN